MLKARSSFVCQDCGTAYPKWSGRCDSCGAWNVLVEEQIPASVPKGLGSKKGRKFPFVGLRGNEKQAPRRVSGIAEFDHVTGGGLVAGSATLVGGDPGIGKSTLLLQVAAALSANFKCAYISGEEAIDHLRLRAQRLGVEDASMSLATATNVRDINSSLSDAEAPDVVIIDSIQTMFIDSLESAPGTVAQVRTSAQELIRLAKRREFSIILVGHVTKDGQIAGPRVLEHMVDTVLYFEGEQSHQFRIMRAVKNRFGPADEIGVFEMSAAGLMEVANPSVLFLSQRPGEVNGASVFASMEGSRPVLVEIQALIATSTQATPRRAVVGWDSGRLAMVMAVLDSRCGLALGGSEVYLNVAGGLKIGEPAADLAVAAALVSSWTGVPVPPKTVVFGEIGLSGEVRAVSHRDSRLKEAEKLGFSCAIVPAVGEQKRNGKTRRIGNIAITEMTHLTDLLVLFSDRRGAVGQTPTVTGLAAGRARHG